MRDLQAEYHLILHELESFDSIRPSKTNVRTSRMTTEQKLCAFARRAANPRAEERYVPQTRDEGACFPSKVLSSCVHLQFPALRLFFWLDDPTAEGRLLEHGRGKRIDILP
jgi:hypothetical protein